MNFKAYQKYIESEHWQNLRQLKFSLVGKRCQSCMCLSGITVHHIRYKNLYDCCPKDLLVLCNECHDILHFVVKTQKLKVEDCELGIVVDLVAEFKTTPLHKRRKRRLKDRRKRLAEEELIWNRQNSKRFTRSEKKQVLKMFSTMRETGYPVNTAEQLRDLLNSFLRIRKLSTDNAAPAQPLRH